MSVLSKSKLAIAIAAVSIGLASASAAQAENIVGLTTTNQLLSFDSAAPTFGNSLISITGLAVNETLLGIDRRPTTFNTIYGISTLNRLYTVNQFTGSASFVAMLSSPLMGQAFGVDFNPVADAAGASSLRVVSNADQNLAINANTGVVTTQTPLNPGDPTIVGSAYTNNVAMPASTALYSIDSAADALFQQDTPPGGTQVPIGPLGVDTTGLVGFDVSGATATPYASLTNGLTGESGLYTINLASGAATLVGLIGIGGNTAIAPALVGITVSPIPEPSTWALMVAGLIGVGVVARRRRKAEGAPQ